MLNYIYKKYKDVYTLENTGLVTLNYSIFIVNCDSTKLVNKCTVAPGKTIILPITQMDGKYTLIISDALETVTIENILQYDNLLRSFIKNTNQQLCDCDNCSDCRDCKESDCESCQNSLFAINKGLSYMHVNAPMFTSYFEIFAKVLSCQYNEGIICSVLGANFKGKEDIEYLNNLNIALFYLTFYHFSLIQAIDEEEAEYLKNKFHSTIILKCIKKLGININEFNQLIYDDMKVYFWQFDNVQEDIYTLVPMFNETTLVDKPQLDFTVFEQGFIVPYTKIGRIVFAIKQTDILNYEFTDSLGNDVTDEFENHYYPEQHTVIFVSKIPYSYSNVFFKFKKITNI